MTQLVNYVPWFSANETNSITAKYLARHYFYNNSLNYANKDFFSDLNSYLTKQDLNNLPFNDLYRENALYGYLDLDGDVILPKKNSNNFILIGNGLSMLDFVGSAFNAMRIYINSQVIKPINCIPRTSKFFNIQPVEAYFDSDDLYAATYTSLANSFLSFLQKNQKVNNKIKNHIIFNQEYIKFLKMQIYNFPVTKTRNTLFYNFKKFCNGLTVSFSNDDRGNDTNKYIEYYMDPGFPIFVDACSRYGFNIDKNNPFIITADLSSPQMQKFMKNVNINSIDDLFKKRYRKIYLEDLQEIKEFFYNSYDIFSQGNELYTDDVIKYCSKEANRGILRYREQVTRNIYFKDFPDVYWIKLYIYFKNYEVGLNLNQQQFENLARDASILIKYNKEKDALRLVNSKFTEIKNIHFFGTLQQKDGVVQERPTQESLGPPNLIFRG